MRRLRVRDAVFRVVTTSRQEGPTFVLVHGIGVSHRYLTRLHRELAALGTVHSIDLPGFGGLPKPKRPVDVAEMAGMIGEVLDRAGVGRCVVIGHSMGAQWAIELAVQRPERVSHVVAMSPVADDRHRTPLRQAVALTLDTLGEPPHGNLVVLGDYLRCGTRWYLAQLRMMLAHPTEDRAAKLRAPLLVLHGGDDPVAGREWCRRLRDAAPAGRFAYVPGHRHLVQWTAPRTCRAAITAFVEGASGR